MTIRILLKLLISVFILIKPIALHAEIKNSIVAKVGNQIITSVDLENEIRTLILTSKDTFNQENINLKKPLALKALISKSIKKSEISKYAITSYNKNDLAKIEENAAKLFNTDKKGLEEIFKVNKINYESFVDKYKTELLWNTLVFKIYRNKVEVNPIEVENTLQKILKNSKEVTEYKLSEIEITEKDLNENKLNEIYKFIDQEGFDKAAKKFSASLTSIDGGNIGWFSQEILSKAYLDEIRKINKGEVTQPIKSLGLIVIIKLNDTKIINQANIDVEELKKKIILNKKDEKLKLFSRSHYSNLEKKTLINFL